jgi:hypothetical protein
VGQGTRVSKSLVSINKYSSWENKLPFECRENTVLWAKCKIRRSSLKKPQFDPSVSRLWWVIVEKDPFVTEYAYTLEELKESYHSLKSYAPADAVPPESEWVKV